MEIPEKLLQPYNPKETEPRLYKLWEESGFFNPDICVEKGVTDKGAKPFTIVMPPPNVTGVLHMGHAMMLTLEDIMIRYKRMQGFKTLWIPGTDHAAIATQSKVEKEIQKKEGLSRHDLGREELLKRVRQFAKESHDTIASQIRVMGSSCDWSREAFTLDDKRTKAVYTMFKKMYEDGLIYRGHRIVNWDPKGQTTIADDEIVYETRKSKLYTFKYAKDFPISISTTRPETKVGDVAVAVHPSDTRYSEFVGKEYDLEFCGVPIHIKIIADEAVEKDFGTGALGVTPAHSMTDWEIADRHNLPRPQVINEYAKMMVGGENILGKKTIEAREVIAEWLRSENLLEKEEDVEQNVGTAERTGGIIEPLPKLQWFISVNKEVPGQGKTLKDIMREPIENETIKIIPEYFDKTYFHWIDNLRDWCISRQIWYGHRVPVWYDDKGKEYAQKKITVYLARHGESEFNLSKTFTTQEEADNTKLTDKGKEDARNLGKSLREKKITKIVRSDLFRAKQTTDIVLEEIGWDKDDIEIWKDLREVRIGDNAGNEKPKDYNPLKFSIENNIQTLDEVEKQGKKVIEKLSQYNDGDCILIVGHNAINSVFAGVNNEIPKEEFIENRKKMGLAKNGSYYEITILVNPEGKNLKQDEDTLDTWFSSALWTFSTLGWPDQTKDLEVFHPTDVLETGYEILFFWVARMIMMSGYALDTIPFHSIYLHGTVRDGQGRKMSKSLGNGIDPLDIADKFGSDAGRMALVVGTAPGTDSKISEDKIKGYKNFCNKLWNITRFILSNTYTDSTKPEICDSDLKIIEEFNLIIKDVTDDLDNFRFHLASEKLYQYAWHRFADVIIEESKTIFASGSETDKKSKSYTLFYIHRCLIKLLHPFMPFVTEEIWSMLPYKDRDLLMVSKWPEISAK